MLPTDGRANGRTEQRTDKWTDGPTQQGLESRVRDERYDALTLVMVGMNTVLCVGVLLLNK